MIKTESVKEKLKSIKILPYFLGSLVSLICALALVLVFALFVRFFGVTNSLITPINIVIKIISITLGVAIATKNGRKGIVKGAIVGVLFTILCQLSFAIISRSFSFGLTLLSDFALALAIGSISGIIFVNLKKS